MKAPRFWSGKVDPYSREAAPLTRLLLTPAAWIYSAITARRIKTATPVETDATVICVGNLTAGGVGKSPIVKALRDRISAKTDLRVATLSRGYGGKLKGPLKVDPTLHIAADVGDEPLMLSQSGESWIGADRAAAGLAMAAEGVSVIIMDDGHQNPGLYKDFSFVAFDAADPIGNGHIIPKGPLRESVAAGLSRAEAIILVGEGEFNIEEGLTALPRLRARTVPTSNLPSGPLVAFAGIGRPEKFFETLTEMNADVRDAVPFGDHHVYSDADLRYLKALALDNDARLVTTEKDYARLSEEDRGYVDFLTIGVEFDDTNLLDSLIENVLKQRSDDQS